MTKDFANTSCCSAFFAIFISRMLDYCHSLSLHILEEFMVPLSQVLFIDFDNFDLLQFQTISRPCIQIYWLTSYVQHTLIKCILSHDNKSIPISLTLRLLRFNDSCTLHLHPFNRHSAPVT